MKNIEYYKGSYINDLKLLGVSKEDLWLCECSIREGFSYLYSSVTELELNRDFKSYVIYYHINNTPTVVAFFDTEDEYTSSCRFIYNYLKQ